MRRAWPRANVIDYFLHIVWPLCCPICGKLGGAICGGCLSDTTGEPKKFCMDCGNPEPCPAHPGGPYCHSVSEYGEITRDIVHEMKYSGRRDIADAMGEILAYKFVRPDVEAIVPIPLHKASDRDYNQALVMARGVSRVWNIPVWDILEWKTDLPRQVRKSAGSDRVLPDDAVILKSHSSKAGASVFLIDDVCTTGSTMRAAKRALESKGLVVAGSIVWSRGRN